MKKIFFLSALFVSNLLYSQIKSIECEYVVNVKDFDFKDQYQRDMFEMVKREIVDYKFLLRANQNSCFFSEVKGLNKEDKKYDMVKLAVNLSSDVFISIKDSLLIKKPSYDNDINLICDFTLWSWEFLDESKEIEGFICYKSIGRKIIKRDGMNKTVSVTAWYCPTVPFKFGPSEFHGLPGLIFEVNSGNIVYGLSSLKFNNFELTIDKPTGKNIKEEEYMIKNQ